MSDQDMMVDLNRKFQQVERQISRPPFRRAFEALVILGFVIFVLLPPLNLLRTVLVDWQIISDTVFNDPILGDTVWLSIYKSISLSFRIALIVTFIDVLIGVPIAHIMARYEFRGKTAVDTIIDLPLVVPTSALGFSIMLFWGSRDGLASVFSLETGLFDAGPALLILGHVAFTFSYIVRNLKGVIEDVDQEVETAGRTFGAAPVSVFRTITAPMAKEGIIAGVILAFTRSLGETGASIILAGVNETAPIQIVTFMNGFQVPQAAFLSLILITISITLLSGVRQYARRVGIPQPYIFPKFERLLSSRKVVRTRNAFSWSFFVFMVLIPATFVIVYLISVFSVGTTGRVEDSALYEVFQASDNKWETMQISLITSIEVALLVTIFNLILGVPMAYILVKRTYWGRWRVFLDALVDVPLVIPSSALGFAVFLLWGGLGLNLVTPGIWLIVMAHLTFTYPFSVRPLISYFENFDYSYYEAGRTLGASDFASFRKVVLPLVRGGIFSAAILTFTRSISETGATLIVMGNSRTIPVYIIDLVESEALPAASFAATVVIFIAFLLLLMIRSIDRRN
ncbi:MAG: ABC transporter permease [Candidatus Kariarchaeaceae archaeon]|jgi:thiamine transport system permease protein